MAALFLSSLSQAIDDIQTSPSTITAFASPAAFTTDEAKMRHDVARHLGMLFGTALKNEGFRSEDFNLDTLCRELAIRLALQGHKIPEPAFKKEIETLAQRTACDIITRRQQTVAETNKTRSRRFMAENAEKPGIITTDSGLQYRIDKQGNGPTYNRYTDKPTRATVKLTVETLDGKLLDNTDDQTNSLTPGYTGIPGLEEALNFMPAGSSWTLYIPEDLAHEKDTPNAWFGTGGNPRTYASRMRQPCIPPHSALIITIELLEFKTVEPFSDIYFQPLIAPPPVCEMPSIACADICSRLQLSPDDYIDELLPETRLVLQHFQQELLSRIMGEKMAEYLIASAFLLQDVEMDAFRSGMQSAFRHPLDMDTLYRGYQSMPSMRAKIEDRQRQEAAQAWLRGQEFIAHLRTTNNDIQFAYNARGSLDFAYLTINEGSQEWQKPESDTPGEEPSFFYMLKYRIRDIDGFILKDCSTSIQEMFSQEDELFARIYSFLENEKIGFKGILYMPPLGEPDSHRYISDEGLPVPGNSLLIVELEFLGIKTSADF